MRPNAFLHSVLLCFVCVCVMFFFIVASPRLKLADCGCCRHMHSKRSEQKKNTNVNNIWCHLSRQTKIIIYQNTVFCRVKDTNAQAHCTLCRHISIAMLLKSDQSTAHGIQLSHSNLEIFPKYNVNITTAKFVKY